MEQFAFQQPPKTSNEGALCVDDDKLFQTRGPATKNARSPMVVRRALGMSSLAEAEDRSLVTERSTLRICLRAVKQLDAVLET